MFAVCVRAERQKRQLGGLANFGDIVFHHGTMNHSAKSVRQTVHTVLKHKMGLGEMPPQKISTDEMRPLTSNEFLLCTGK